MQNNLVQIPAQLFKEAVCKCGCSRFDQQFKIMHYQGVMSNQTAVVQPVVEFVCKSCEHPFTVTEQKNSDDSLKIVK